MNLLTYVITLTILAYSSIPARAADTPLPASAQAIAGAPVQAVGCTAERTDSQGGYLADFYIRGNASFVNDSSQPATAVDILIHYEGAYGNHDILLTKRGSFAPGVRIDPKRRTLIAMLQPETLNIDTDGSREIDIWNTVSATCTVVAAQFADGSVWRYDEPSKPLKQLWFDPKTLATPAPSKCHWDSASNRYSCP